MDCLHGFAVARDERGATTEYVVLLILLALGCIFAISRYGTTLGGQVENVGGALDESAVVRGAGSDPTNATASGGSAGAGRGGSAGSSATSRAAGAGVEDTAAGAARSSSVPASRSKPLPKGHAVASGGGPAVAPPAVESRSLAALLVFFGAIALFGVLRLIKMAKDLREDAAEKRKRDQEEEEERREEARREDAKRLELMAFEDRQRGA